MLDIGSTHSHLVDQEEHDSGIKLTWPGAHGQPVERRESHGTFHAASAKQGAHRGAAAQMGNDNAPARQVRRDLRQALGDVFVREAVEAVSAHALGVEMVRQRVVVGNRAMAAMKRRVEACDLGQVRKAGENRSDRRQVAGLVQRGQRSVPFQVRKHAGIDHDRPVICRTAVHDPMTDSDWIDVVLLAQPVARMFAVPTARRGPRRVQSADR